MCHDIFTTWQCQYHFQEKTEKVTEYWDSIEDYDYDFHGFRTKKEMEERIREIASEETPYITWILYQVEDFSLGDFPPTDKGIELGNPFGKLVLTENRER